MGLLGISYLKNRPNSNSCSIIGVDVIEVFSNRIADAGNKVNKGIVQKPWDKPINIRFITEMTQYCLLQVKMKK